MAFGYNRINYGIHSICPYIISDKMPYGILKVLGGGTLTLSSEFEDLFGGSSKFSWAVEAKTISAEWTATVKSLPDFLFELFLGATVTTTAASATGTVSDLVAASTTLIPIGATGIASVAKKTGGAADLKDSVYVVKVASATTVDVYAMTDIEFKKLGGAALSYIDEALKITATPLTIVAATAVEIPNTGIELMGGSGTIAMAVGATATFHVFSAHAGMSEIKIGSSSTTFPEHGQLCLSQKRANGDVFEMEMYRVVGSGMPIPLEEQAFSIPELAMKLVYDTDEDAVAIIRAKRGI